MKVPLRLSVCVVWAATLAGCSEVTEPKFVLNQPTLNLIPEAQQPVTKALDDYFGTATQLVGWRELPVNYGIWNGRVVKSAAEGGAAVAGIPVQLVEKPEGDLKGKTIQWVTGGQQGKRATVKSWSAAGNTLQLPEGSAAAPAVGDEFIVFQQGTGGTLEHGRNMYMVHCLHCHGVSGDGNGPTAKFLEPRPRDYRQGKFKFKSTQRPLMPSRADLVRTLQEGVPGTSMPSFVLLKDEDMDAIIEYVRWLSMRGSFEMALVNSYAGKDVTKEAIDKRIAGSKDKPQPETRASILAELKKSIEEEFPDAIKEAIEDITGNWARADAPESIVNPKSKRTVASSESIARGRALFLDKKIGCADCHGVTGVGNGKNTELYWPMPGEKQVNYEHVGLHDDWGRHIQPRNLTRGVYRGGRRPIDLYRRLYAGINGTPMQGFATSLDSDEKLWDVVNYVMSVPFDGKVSPELIAGAEEQSSSHVAASRK